MVAGLLAKEGYTNKVNIKNWFKWRGCMLKQDVK